MIFKIKKRKSPVNRILEEIEAKRLFYSCHPGEGEELCPRRLLKGPSVPVHGTVTQRLFEFNVITWSERVLILPGEPSLLPRGSPWRPPLRQLPLIPASSQRASPLSPSPHWPVGTPQGEPDWREACG